MSGTIDQEVAAAEVPVDDGRFFFSLTANDAGVQELKFRKNAGQLFSTLFFALDYINGTFDQPFPSLGAFLRDMADKADQMEAAYHANQQARSAAEGADTQAPENSEPAAN